METHDRVLEWEISLKKKHTSISTLLVAYF